MAQENPTLSEVNKEKQDFLNDLVEQSSGKITDNFIEQFDDSDFESVEVFFEKVLEKLLDIYENFQNTPLLINSLLEDYAEKHDINFEEVVGICIIPEGKERDAKSEKLLKQLEIRFRLKIAEKDMDWIDFFAITSKNSLRSVFEGLTNDQLEVLGGRR